MMACGHAPVLASLHMPLSSRDSLQAYPPDARCWPRFAGIFGTGAGTSDAAVPTNTTVAVLQAATQQLHVENHQYKEKLAAAQAELDVLRRVVGSGPNAAAASDGGGGRDDAAVADLYLQLQRLRAELDTLTTTHATTKRELSKSKEELQSAMCDLAVARREVAQQQRTLMTLQQPAGALHTQLAAFLDTLTSAAAPAAPTAATKDAAPAEWATFEAKMRGEGLGDHAIVSFRNNYQLLVSGATGMLPEASLRSVTDLPRLQDLQGGAHNPELLGATVCLKLNGGLGTGMGLEKAKSLLAVKDGLTFLDYIALQILHLREQHKHDVKFVLMNSFATSDDTRAALAKYPELHADEFIQNKVPKVDAGSLQPVSWAAAAAQEWCPPGHGDLYAAIAGSGTLSTLLAAGYKYLFVSNSDNLGATLDLDILTYFAQTDTPFMMEVCERTASDKKGGHLARRAADGKLVLRESAQCAKEDEAAFQDISTHRFFNTNNLWVRLDRLQAKLDECGGLIPLPMIKNVKTVDPRDKTSPKVFQLETAMGAAIESFDGAAALVVPRTRFAPVKTTADLLALRSDVYEVTTDHRLQLPLRILGPGCGKTVGNQLIAGRDKPPTISLDEGYKLVDQLEAAFGATGAPSLRECSAVTIRGPVAMDSAKVVFQGDVTITNIQGDTRANLPDGVYSGATTLPL